MKAQILSIGAELVLGQTVNTNAAWMAKQLAAVGVPCTAHLTVDDDKAAITEAFRRASAEADLVLASGGLGPTPDDLTRDALADAMGEPLVLHPPSLDYIAAFFKERKRTMTESNRIQAMFPRSAEPITNTCGTAPGIRARLNDADIFCMPGVPYEMRLMFEQNVLPMLAGVQGTQTILAREIHLFGVPESKVGEVISDLMAPGRNPAVGTSAGDWVITVRIKARAAGADAARQMLDADAAEIYNRFKEAVVAEGEEALQHAAVKLLIEKGKTVSTAESCTGGLIAKRLTDVSGASACLTQGVVTYANEAKQRLLDVPAELIAEHGAVSEPVARIMATNCRLKAGTDYALSTTGVAGPTGGTPAKPIGLVFIGIATPDTTFVQELRCGETLSREAVRDRTAKVAINMLRLALLGKEPKWG